jgi:hypothetical protein
MVNVCQKSWDIALSVPSRPTSSWLSEYQMTEHGATPMLLAVIDK